MPKIKIYPQTNKQKGQVLIDVLIAGAIFAILAYAIIQITVVIYETIGYIRTKTIAKNIAAQQMEFLNNLPYNQLGTKTGIPSGIIDEFTQENHNSQLFKIHTSITYIDDPFDNTVPNDILPTDYKQVRVEISWDGQFDSGKSPVVLVTNIAPKGVENQNGGGTLSILAINGQAQPIAAAAVHITNNSVVPNIDVNYTTNQDGYLILPGAPPCASCYNISVTKEEYSTERTYTVAEIANPNKQALTVTAGRLSESTFIIDRTANYKFISYLDDLRSGSKIFRLTGSKSIGTDLNDQPVYKFDQTLTTAGNGEITIPNLEADTYILSLPNENFDMAGSNPYLPLLVNPYSNGELKFNLTSKTDNSLLMLIKNASGSAIATVSAILELAPSFIATDSSGQADQPDFGQVFFKDLSASSYSFTLNHPSYQIKTGNINVNGYTVNNLILYE